jgi:hypothetical protein
VRYHAELAQDAGFIEAEFMMDGFIVQRLTYAGHEFLDAAREEKLWNKAKQTVLSNAGTLTVEALKIALSMLMQQAVSAIGYDRIKELCAKAVATPESPELERVLQQLQKALHEHSERLRKLVAHYPDRPERRRRIRKVEL